MARRDGAGKALAERDEPTYRRDGRCLPPRKVQYAKKKKHPGKDCSDAFLIDMRFYELATGEKTAVFMPRSRPRCPVSGEILYFSSASVDCAAAGACSCVAEASNCPLKGSCVAAAGAAGACCAAGCDGTPSLICR